MSRFVRRVLIILLSLLLLGGSFALFWARDSYVAEPVIAPADSARI